MSDTIVIANTPQVIELSGEGPAVLVANPGTAVPYTSGFGIEVDSDKAVNIGGGVALTETRTIALGSNGVLRQLGTYTDSRATEAGFYWEVTDEDTGEVYSFQVASDSVPPTFSRHQSAQYASPYQTLSYGASVAWNFASGQASTLTLTGDATLQAPTNLHSITPILEVVQDGVGGHTLSFASGYVVDTAGVTTEAGSVTVYSFVVGRDGVIRGVGKTFAS